MKFSLRHALALFFRSLKKVNDIGDLVLLFFRCVLFVIYLIPIKPLKAFTRRIDKRIINRLSEKEMKRLQSTGFLQGVVIGDMSSPENQDNYDFASHTYFDIKVEGDQIPPATGLLRMVQFAHTSMLDMLDKLFGELGISWWLLWGNLLGACRHKGFVPWDDDVDIGMMYEDAVKLYDYLSTNESSLFTIRIAAASRQLNLIISLKELDEDIHVGIFICAASVKYDDALQAQLSQLQHGFENSSALSDENTALSAYIKMLQAVPKGDKSLIFFHRSQSPAFVFEYDSIFPLDQADYEGRSFPVPFNCNAILVKLYGEDWRSPRIKNSHVAFNKKTVLKQFDYIKSVNPDFVFPDL